MSDYFGRLAARTLDPSSLLKPRIDARFAARDEIEETADAESLPPPRPVAAAPEREPTAERVALGTPFATATPRMVTAETTPEIPRAITATLREVHERSETKHTEASRHVIVEEHERRESAQLLKVAGAREEIAALAAEGPANTTHRIEHDAAAGASGIRPKHEVTPQSMEVTSHSMEAASPPALPLPERSSVTETQAAAVPRAEAIRISADAPPAASPRIEARMVERVIERLPAVTPEPDIHITIGRIDVRAVTPASTTTPPPPRRDPRPKTLSLEEYLAQRNEARR